MDTRTTSVLFAMKAVLAAGALAGSPVRDLLADADRADVRFTSSALSVELTNAGSLHVLRGGPFGDAPTVLVSSPHHWPGGTGSWYRTEIIDPATYMPLLSLSRQPNSLAYANTAALWLGDRNADGVPDLLMGVNISQRAALRAYSGADGALLPGSIFSNGDNGGWGLSLARLPSEGDAAQGRVLMGRTRGGLSLTAFTGFRIWDPASGAITESPAAPGISSEVAHGYVMLDLGDHPERGHEFHISRHAYLLGFSGLGFSANGRLRIDPFDFDDRVVCDAMSGCQSGHAFAGAALLGDLTGDGRPEILSAGAWSSDDPTLAALVLDGDSGQVIGLHTPSIDLALVPDFQPSVILPTGWVASVGDITGDGFPDYALVALVTGESDGSEPAPVSDVVFVQCGRTGQTILALTGGLEPTVRLTSSILAGPYTVRRDSVVSPGDLNADGTDDLLALVSVVDSSASPPTQTQYLVTHHLPTPCAGDTNFDRAVNFADLNTVLSAFGAEDITSPADLNADGVVNFADLNLVLSAFGQSCD
ncbi:MAG: hypothetical protein KF684_11735 [Phycisphaeraceae bacterium]|nr:hypothetical protein [Phycisphaeraceae bacterium]